jgi:hypothetical protein
LEVTATVSHGKLLDFGLAITVLDEGLNFHVETLIIIFKYPAKYTRSKSF